jgi:hypothetical protein
MQNQILQILQDQYPFFTFSKVAGTSHWNVVRIYNPFTDKYYIAKAIVDFTNNNITNENRLASNTAWELETEILGSLPSWWGIEYMDSFREGHIRIIVTSEIPNKSWIFYKPSKQLDETIALDLAKQLWWLSEAGISHNDLELKNILFTGDRAIIIDFEKATHSKGRDAEKLIESFSEKENLMGIVKYLKAFLGTRRAVPRRASMRKRHRNRRTRKQ